jgi:O-antigen/teichoic acid export membrane protein
MSASLQPRAEEHDASDRAEQIAVVRGALARNISRDAAARVGYLLTRILIPSFVLARIGLSAYSVWSAIFIMVSYVGVTTMGLSVVYVKYTAEFTARGEADKANSLLSTGLFSMAAVCGACFVLLVLELHPVLVWLRVPAHIFAQAQTAVMLVIGAFLCDMVFSVFPRALAGSHKIAETQGIWVISYVSEMVLIFYLVGTGHGLIGLAEAFVVREVLSIGLNGLLAFRMLPWLRISPRRISFDSLRTLAGFGSVVQLSSFFCIALNTIERVIAAPLIGLSAVGILDLSDKWPTMSSMIADAFAASFLPAASYLKGGRTEKRTGDATVVQLYLRGGRYMNLASSSICALLATISGPLLMAWLGGAFPASAYLMTIFAVQQNIHHMTGPGTSILKGIGRPRDEWYYLIPNILMALVAIPLSRLVLGHWSAAGLGSAVVIATVSSALFFVVHANRILGVSWRRYLKIVVAPGLVPYLIGILVGIPVWKFTQQGSRWHALVIVAAGGLVYALTLALAIDRAVFDAEERHWFHGLVRRELARVTGTIGFGESDESTH